MKKSGLVVKTNYLNTVLQNLSLSEIRIIQLAIVDARETNTGLSTDKPLRIEASRYAEVFGTTKQAAYIVMIEAEETLFNRRFSFLDDDNDAVKSRWIQQVKYCKNQGAIELIFTTAVVEGISRIDGAEDFFTSYLLSQTANMKSNYSVRLYELLVQWKEAKKTPTFEIETLRGQLGIGVDEYTRMYDFKQRVLDAGIKEINSYSDLDVSYEQQKRGKSISGFSFTIKVKKTDKPKAKEAPEDTFIQFTAKQLSTFSMKLAKLSDLGSDAPMGASTEEYAAKISKDLLDPGKQKKYIKHLNKVGYKAA